MNFQHNPPAATTAMLIRRPVAEVFEAFIDPAITSKFWFTDGSSKLEKGKQVTWNWSTYNHTSFIDVIDIVKDKKIEITWGAKDAARTRVTWTFETYPDNNTFVNIVCDKFEGDDDSIIKQLTDTTGGFCWVIHSCAFFCRWYISYCPAKGRSQARCR